MHRMTTAAITFTACSLATYLAFFVAHRSLRAEAEPAGPSGTTVAAKPEAEALFFTPAGFNREGKPATAGGDGAGRVHAVVIDRDTGKPTACQLNVVGADGNFYQPPPNHLSPYALTGQWPTPGAWGNRAEKAPYRYIGRFFYTWGEATVPGPAGPVRVEVWKGLEYAPQTLTTLVPAGATRDVRLTLERAVPMAAHGYYAGDPHLHFPRQGERDEETTLDLLEAEDVRYGSVLGYNEPAGPYA